VKIHYGDPLLGHFLAYCYNTYSIIIPKYGAFNFGYQFWFLGSTIIILAKPMLCNIILKITINFIIYIEGSMGVFIIYIGIIGPLFRFDYTNFKVSLVI
jgi:hypothetical protein